MKKISQRKRINWIDVCRGIGIILVIYGHSLSSDQYRYLIYSFHMPLFFFLSGILFRVKTYERFLIFLLKVAKGILIPYFIFATASYLHWLFLDNGGQLTLNSFVHHVYGLLYGSGRNDGLFYNVVLWFLPCLFITKIIFATLTKITTHRIFLISSLAFFSVFGFLFSRIFPTTKLPFNLETAFTAVVFFGIGYLISNYTQSLAALKKHKTVLLFLGSGAVCIILATITYSLYGSQIDMRTNRLHNYGLFYLSALSGILAFLALSVLIRRNILLEYIGRHSMLLLGSHMIVFSYITDFFRFVFTQETFKALRNLYLAPLYTMISISVILFTKRTAGKIRSSLSLVKMKEISF